MPWHDPTEFNRHVTCLLKRVDPIWPVERPCRGMALQNLTGMSLACCNRKSILNDPNGIQHPLEGATIIFSPSQFVFFRTIFVILMIRNCLTFPGRLYC